MRTLVTGITGFVGQHLAARLRDAGHAVRGWSRAAGPGVTATDWQPATLLADLRRDPPEAVVHLAGFANAGASFQHADAAWAANLDLTRRLFDAVAAAVPTARLLFVSTGQVYGPSTEPIREDAPLLPASPYAASKAAADLLAYQVTRHPGLAVVRVRPFNHIGPGQSPDYAASSFARQIARIRRGEQPPTLDVGDLSAARDLLDVRDVAEAYRVLLDRGEPGRAYNVGTGDAVTMREVVDRLAALAGVAVTVRTAADRLRPVDAATLRADATALRTLGWSPAVPLDQTLADMLADWDRRDAR